MSETLSELQTQYDEYKAVLDRVIKGKASASAGDRSWQNHDPESLQRILDRLKAKMDALERGSSFGTTVMRARRGR